MNPPLIAVLGAVVIGYVVGAVPVAWILVRRRHGLDLRRHGRGGTSAFDALLTVGPRTALLAVVVESLKGAAVGLAARWYSGSAWFAVVALAACVVGDAFPVGFRHGGRGIVPLVSGLLIALPVAGLLTGLLIVPAVVVGRGREGSYSWVVAMAVPLGLMLGTDDWRSLFPATVIVVVLIVRGQTGRSVISSFLGGQMPQVARKTVVEEPSPRSGLPESRP